MSVTTTRHSVAEATGIAAMPSTPNVQAKVTAPTASFGLLHKMEVRLLAPLALSNFLESSVFPPASLDNRCPGANPHHRAASEKEATDCTDALQRGTVAPRLGSRARQLVGCVEVHFGVHNAQLELESAPVAIRAVEMLA